MSTVFLIGMPGAGKSTLGKALSQQTGITCVDTDDLIAQACGMSLQEYKDQRGYLALRKLEQEVILATDFSGQLVATGGSVVYSERAMQKMQTEGCVVYLKISLETMINRIANQDSRGLAIAQGTSLEDLYEERCSLYEKYARLTVDIDKLNAQESLDQINMALASIDPMFSLRN